LYIWTYICIARDQQWSFHDDDDDDEKTKQVQLPMIDIILPTGAMGNIVAGYMSQLMGLPIRTLVAAVNINDIMYQTINYGTFHKSARMERTLSEAINIQVPYNFERMIYYITNGNDEVVREYYQNLETTDQMTIPLEYLQKIQTIFQSARVTDTQMCDAIRYIYNTYNQYMIDPHTAVAFSAAFQLQYIHQHQQQQESTVPETLPDEPGTLQPNHDSTTVVLATASPCKFEHSVSTAVGGSTWDTYLNSTAYPVPAKRILSMQSDTTTSISSSNIESRIHHYTNPYNIPVSEIQREWEEHTRTLIERLESKNGVELE
jgi:threonine synthase